MRILVISPNMPYPADTGGSIRIFNLLKYLSAYNDIDLICYGDGAINAEDLEVLKSLCTAVHLVKKERQPAFKQIPEVVLRSTRCEPFCLKYGECSAFHRTIEELTSANMYDVVQVEHSYAAGLHRSIKKGPGTQTVLSLHNIASQQYRRMYSHERNLLNKMKLLLDWAPMRKWEPAAAAKFHKMVVVSPADEKTLRKMVPCGRIYLIPNGIDISSHRRLPLNPESRNILMIGTMDYGPNVDGVLYFHEKIFPLVLGEVSDATLTVAGRNPTSAILELRTAAKVTVEANVSDVGDCYARAAVSAVSLRSGGGTRIKILESMAFGVPVVSTSIGCEGLDVTDELDILIADTPQEFARNICRVLTDGALAAMLAKNGRRLVEEKYDWKSIAHRLHSVYTD